MIYSWKKIVKNSTPLLTVCVLVEVLAGQILLSNQDTLLLFPLFLVSFPVINGVGGNIGSVLGARLASGLHMGSIELNIDDKDLRENFFTSIVLGVVSYSVLGVVLYYFVSFFMDTKTNVDFLSYFFVVLCVGFLLVCLLCIVSVIAAFLSFKHGMDPDDVVAPVVTTVGDILGIGFLVLFLVFIGL